MKRVRDPYFHKARREGYAARSAYKLEEIDRRRGLLRAGMRVLDLGCAPGSWMQYAARRVGPKGRVVGVDLQPVTAKVPEQVRLIEADAYDLDPGALLEAAGGPFDVVLSDMGPKTTGVPAADAARSAELVLRVLELARALLRPGGHLLVKVYQGGRFPEVRRACREAFDKVSTEKPKASRSESVEVFLLGLGHRGGAA